MRTATTTKTLDRSLRRAVSISALERFLYTRRSLLESNLESYGRRLSELERRFSTGRDLRNERLKRFRVEDGDEKDRKCIVCLENLEVGSEASTMPCCHTFHSNCIEKWLEMSPRCPICRFQMPSFGET